MQMASTISERPEHKNHSLDASSGTERPDRSYFEARSGECLSPQATKTRRSSHPHTTGNTIRPGKDHAASALAAQDTPVMTPAWMAINACISGFPLNDMEFHFEDEGISTFANRSMLEHACPTLLQRISHKDTLIFDADPPPRRTTAVVKTVNPQALLDGGNGAQSHNVQALDLSYLRSDTSLPTPAHDTSVNNPLNWLRAANTVKKARKQGRVSADAIATVAPSPPPKTDPARSGMRRILVTGCTSMSMRALLFYLFTSQTHFRLPDRQSSSSRRRKDATSAFAGVAGKENKMDVSRSHEPIEGSTASLNKPPSFNAQAAYSLASDLQLKHLQEAAQAFLLAHLQTDTALLHYFTPFCQRFAPIRRGVMAFIETHWHEIRRRPETQQALIRLAHGDFPEGHMALFKLLSRMEVSRLPAAPSST